MSLAVTNPAEVADVAASGAKQLGGGHRRGRINEVAQGGGEKGCDVVIINGAKPVGEEKMLVLFACCGSVCERCQECWVVAAVVPG